MFLCTLMLFTRSKKISMFSQTAQRVSNILATSHFNDTRTPDCSVNGTCNSNRIINKETSNRVTPGMCIETQYFTGVGSLRWNNFFLQNYYLKQKPTAPLYLCPFCEPFNLERESFDNNSSIEEEEESSSTLLHDKCKECKLRKFEQLPRLYKESMREVLHTNTIKLFSPYDMMTHMSFCHAHVGFTHEQLQPYNSYMMQQLKARLSDTHYKSSNSTSQNIKKRRKPFKLLFFIDVANLEMSGCEVVLDMLKSQEVMELFSTVPVAICAVHELSVPQIAKVTHAAFQLSQLHNDSDMFTFYAVSRTESGDALMCALISELHSFNDHLQHMTREHQEEKNMLTHECRERVELCPCIVMTLDGQLKNCLLEMFGSAQMTTAPLGAVHAPRLNNTSVFVQMLWRAISSN